MKRSRCVLWDFTVSRQSPKSGSPCTTTPRPVPPHVSDPGVPLPEDQTFSPAEKGGGISTSPSVIALFM